MTDRHRPEQGEIGHFFARNDNKNELDVASGPFEESAGILWATLGQHGDLLKIENILGGEHPSTPMVGFTYSPSGNPNDYWARSDRKHGQAAAYTDQVKGADGPERRVFVAIDPDTRDPSMHRVVVGCDGYVTDLDNPGVELANDSEFMNAFTAAVNAIDQRLRAVRLAKIEKRKRTGRATAKVIGATVGLATIAAGVGYGVNKWIIEPEKAEEAARAAYDNEDHVLPGELLELQMIDAAVLPVTQFDEIPKMKDGDDLADPRTISVEQNACAEIDLKPKPRQELAVAIREGSILSNGRVTAHVNPEGKIELCVADPSVDALDADYAPIAIQLR